MQKHIPLILFHLGFILSGVGVAMGYPFAGSTHSLFAAIVGNTLFYYYLIKYFRDPSFSTKKLIYGVCLCIYAGNVVGFSWVPDTIKLFSGLEGPIAEIICLGFVLFSCPPVWLIVFLICVFKNSPLQKHISTFYEKYPAITPLVGAVIITAIGEFTPFVFPVKIGSAWLTMAPYLGFAPLFGLAFYTLLTHFISLETIKYINTKKLPKATLLVLSALVTWHLFIPLRPFTEGKNVKVKIVQANIESDLKYLKKRSQRRNWEKLWSRYHEPSTTNTPKDLDLLIWPETSYPFFIDSRKRETFSRQFVKVSEQVGYLLFGGIDHQKDPDKERKHVASFLLKDGYMKKAYHKRKLIIFAEFLPFGPLNKYISKHLPGVANFTHGTVTPTFDLGDDKTFITPICYETLFINYIRQSLNESKTQINFLINMANDAWFRSSQEVHQHEFMARWSAMIYQKPVVRSLNTGRSSIVRNDGVITHRLENLKADVLIGDFLINPKAKPTFYQRWGLFGMFVFAFILLVGIFFLDRFFDRRCSQRTQY